METILKIQAKTIDPFIKAVLGRRSGRMKPSGNKMVKEKNIKNE